MSKSEKQQLLAAFRVAYELAYRRGYQQGVESAQAIPTMVDRSAVARWRASPVKLLATPPPPWGHTAHSAIDDRILSEAREHCGTLREFISSVLRSP